MTKRNHIEDKIQIAVADHLRVRAMPGVVWWHTPNGGVRHIGAAMKFKRMGVRAGVSDILAFYRKEMFCLEIKAPLGNPTEDQLKYKSDMEAQGAFGCIAHGLDQAIACLEAWGLLRRAA